MIHATKSTVLSLYSGCHLHWSQVELTFTVDHMVRGQGTNPIGKFGIQVLSGAHAWSQVSCEAHASRIRPVSCC